MTHGHRMLGFSPHMTPSKKAATFAAAFGSLVTLSAVSSAHVDLSAPAPRAHGETEGNLKSGPCGQTANARTENVTVFAPGESITVEWNEYIDHPSYFRIAFDDDGDDGFLQRQDGQTDPNADDPEAMEAALGMDAEILAIVAEENDTTSGQSTDVRTVTVTLPDIECDNCTLQLTQYMYDNPAQGYFQCADIVLRAEQQAEPADAGAGGGGGAPGGGAGTGGAAGIGGAVSAGTGGAAGTPAAGAPGTAGASSGAGAGAGGAAANGGDATAGTGAVPAGRPIESAGEDDDGGCSIAAAGGERSAAPGLIALLGLALGVVGRRRGVR